MSDQKKNTTYSRGTIQRYLEGTLSPADMHALEKAALEDPFLADAIEGMQADRSARGAADQENDLSELKARLKEKIAEENKKKPRAGIWMRLHPVSRIAAVLILLVGLGGITFYSLFNRSTNKSEIARMETLSRKESRADSTASAGAGTTIPIEADHAAKNDPESSKSIVDSSTFSFNLMDSAVAANVPAGAKKSRRPESDKQASPSAGQASNASQGAALSSSAASLGKIDSVSIARRYDTIDTRLTTAPVQQSVTPHFITGKVVGENERPLAGVSIFPEKDRTKGVSTDSNGYFKIALRRQDSLVRLQASYIGYQPATLAFNTKTNPEPIIRMQANSQALDEVVVIGYGAARRTEVRAEEKKKSLGVHDSEYFYKKKDTAQNAVPVIGWAAYEFYLKNNKPQLKVDTTLKGNEIISFKVNSKGELSSFKVARSLSPTHDSSVIRLIRQGPAWKVSSGRKTRDATVTMSF